VDVTIIELHYGLPYCALYGSLGTYKMSYPPCSISLCCAHYIVSDPRFQRRARGGASLNPLRSRLPPLSIGNGPHFTALEYLEPLGRAMTQHVPDKAVDPSAACRRRVVIHGDQPARAD